VRALALGWLAGCVWLQTRHVLPDSAVSLFMLAMGMAAFCGVLSDKLRVRIIALLLAGLCLGAGWSSELARHRLVESLPSALEGRDLQLTGVVASLPDRVANGQRFSFDVEQAVDQERAVTVPHRITLGWYAEDGEMPRLLPGERWQLTARLKQPHGQSNPYGFDVEAWWLTNGARATGTVRAAQAQRLQGFVFSLRDAVGRARVWLRERISAALPDARYAGVIIALVIGDQRDIAQSDWEVFNRTGIGHLVSISGLHITMIAALFSGLVHFLWRHSFFIGSTLPLHVPARKVSAAAGLLVALLYVALAGFGIPAQRTLLMLTVATLAVWSHRILPASQVLACALLAVLLFDPWAVLWPGFWLSFGAIACLLFASSGGMEHRDHASTRTATMKQALQAAGRTQLAVTAGLLPLTMLLFGQFSLVSPISNAVAIPVVSFVVTPLALLGSAMPAPLCAWLLQLAHGTLSLLAQWLAWLSSLPLAVWQAPRPELLPTLLAAAGTLWLLAPRGWPMRWAGALTWLPLIVAVADAPTSGVRVTAFDIGQGNALLVETRSFRLLYDTGPAYSTESDGGSRVLVPYLRARGIMRLDALVISHSDSDHAGGARTLMETIDIGWVASSLPASNPLVDARHVACVAGQRWLRDGVAFEFLHPLSSENPAAKPNARSCTLKISVGEQAVLLTGDIEAPQERALLARDRQRLRADVLLAPHHGSGTSSTVEFLEAVQPQVAVFQMGYRNRYRHPKPEVVERYTARGIRVLRSDQTGAMTLSLDGQRLKITQACETPSYWSSQRCVTQAMQITHD
jgi:competence protein ComEC